MPQDKRLEEIGVVKRILDSLPCVSMKLKLNAKEKFIWLNGQRECREVIFKALSTRKE